MVSQNGLVTELPIHPQIAQQIPLENVLLFHRMLKNVNFHCICGIRDDKYRPLYKYKLSFEMLLSILTPTEAFK